MFTALSLHPCLSGSQVPAAFVFDPPGATFRDKLFEKYKAQRQPMPDEMRVQLPLVRRLCEAMRLPILEIKGYEADDVIGTMAVKAGKHNLEVLIEQRESEKKAQRN